MKIASLISRSHAESVLARVAAHAGHQLMRWHDPSEQSLRAACRHDCPDLLVIDLDNAAVDALSLIHTLVSGFHCMVLVLTDHVERHSAAVIKALAAGARDVVEVNGDDPHDMQEMGIKIKQFNSLISANQSAKCADITKNQAPTVTSVARLVVIGASSGGPRALAHILAQVQIPATAALVVIQHLDERFGESMASWLSEQTQRTIDVAREGDSVSGGRIILASSNDHLVLTPGLRLHYTADPIDLAYRPSVDVFMQSVVQYWPGQVLGVVLTGMGSDGAKGLLGLKYKGMHTVAQDKMSSTVFGMPKAAIEAGAVKKVLSLDEMAPAINQFMGDQADN